MLEKEKLKDNIEISQTSSGYPITQVRTVTIRIDYNDLLNV